MKLLHTSDWHLGKKLNDLSRFDEQKEVLQEICEIAENEHVNAVIVAGDLFDSFNPSSEAQDLFYKTLKRLSANGKRAVIAIAGNHDSPERIEAPDPLAIECGIIFTGFPNSKVKQTSIESGLTITNSEEGFIELKLPGVEEALRILLTPYANEYRLKTFLSSEDPEKELREVLKEKWNETASKYCDDKGVNILATHLFIVKKGEDLPEEPEDEKPILHVGGAQVVYSECIPEQVQYTALGHLHRKQTITLHPAPVVYSGSPLAYSFSEADQKKYVNVVDLKPGLPAEIKEIELKKGKRLLRKRSESIDEALIWLQENQDCLVELTIVTEDYLTGEDRNRLLSAHDFIVYMIPEYKGTKGTEMTDKSRIDLSKSMEDLFKDFFRYSHMQEPNEDIINLFREVLAEEEDY